ncbi:MAG: hypothetical protein L6R39_001467 [Caloplaca ligustica]|nr:MAG: hypothetical protein L6R39_001467 [Caloplaca ligustica]
MDIQVALLEWINTFTLAEQVKSPDELIDGHILWDILRDVDPAYFASGLPESQNNTTKWVPRYENLKFLHKTLASYITEECDQTLLAPHAAEGLQAIAQNASTPELVKLFQLVLQATILSPSPEMYILKMTSLSPASQKALKELIEEREIVEEPNAQQDGASEIPATFAPDSELELEERLGRLMAENERLVQERVDMQSDKEILEDRLITLKRNNTVLQQGLREAEDRLQMTGSGPSGIDTRYVKDLELKIKQQENDLADQEDRTEKQARQMDALRKKIDNLEASLNSSARKAQDARDELDAVTKERNALTKKANMVDKFKQQLQTSNDLKKENETLRSQLDEYRIEIRSVSQVRVGLETELEEFKKLMPRIEEDNAELFRRKRQLELDNESLHKRCSIANKRYKQDQATIAQLKQRVRSSSVSSIGSHDDDTLEGEFSGLKETQTRVQERTSSIEEQNRQLETTASEQASKIMTLQRLLDEANSRPKRHNDLRRASFGSSASAERAGPASRFGVPTMNGIAQSAHSLLSIDVLQKLRAQLDAEETKRKKVDVQLQKTMQELDLVKKDRRSLNHRYMNADAQHSNHLAVAYVAMDKLEIIAQIKADNSSGLRDLQDEHTLLQETNDGLESENREQGELLLRSIGQHAAQDLSKVSEEIKDLTAAVKAGKPLEDPTKVIDVFSHMIMDSRKELVETQKVNREIVLPLVEAQPSQPLVEAQPSHSGSLMKSETKIAALKKDSTSASGLRSWFKKGKVAKEASSCEA